MAVTKNRYTAASGSLAGPYNYAFPVIADTDIKVAVNGVIKTVTTHYTLDTGNTRITFVSGQEPSVGDYVDVYRDTDDDPITTTFVAGSTLRSGELNDNFKQVLYLTQEADNQGLSTLGGTMDGTIHMGRDQKITFEGSVDDGNDTTLTVANPTGARTITLPNVTGTVITTGDTKSITGGMIDDNTIAAAQLAPNSVGNSEIADNAVNTAEINNGAVNHDKLTSDSVIEAKIANNAVTTAKINTNAVTNNELASNAVNTVNIVNGAVNHDKLTSDSVIEAKIANNAVTTNKILNDAVTADKIADAVIVTNSEQSAHTADDVTFFTTAASDARYFNISSGDTIKDGQTFPDDDISIATTAAINDRIVDLVEEVGGFVPIANETSFPLTHPDINNGTGTLLSIKEIASTRTPSGGTVTIANGAGSSTVTITGCGSTTLTAGFGCILETTNSLHTYSFHRLSPKATEVTTVAGISANITTVANNNTNVTTVAGSITNVNTTATNIANVNTAATNISKITTVADDLNEGTSEIDTVATNIANVNTVGGAVTNVNNVGNNIASVNTCATNLTAVEHYGDTYQVGTGAPTQRPDGTSLVIGDLWYDSSSNKQLMVRDGSSGDGYSAATPSQSVLTDIATVSGNITYSEDLGTIADALTTGSGNSIEVCADNIAKIQALGASAVVDDMALLATTDCIADMALLATTDAIADMNLLGTSAVIADMNLLGTSACVADMATIADTSNLIANIGTVAGIQANVTTVAGIQANVTTVAGNNSNVTTVAGSIADVNRYANEYKIASSAPGSPSEGDLWYDSTNNVLKYYTGSSWTGISDAGINNVLEDTTPELGGHLDCNDKNLTEVGTVSGNNLQIDFGTL